MKKQTNNPSNNHYKGIMKDFQQLGSTFKNVKYATFEQDPYSPKQNLHFKRVMYGLNVFTKEELDKMHWSKKKRIKKVNQRAQKEINLLKQERCITLSNTLFQSLFTDATLTHQLVEEFSTPSPKVFNTLSLKDLKIGKEEIIKRLIDKGILPSNFKTM